MFSWLKRMSQSKSPTGIQHIRETLGRALRETGQALDRIGIRTESLTWLPPKYVGQDPIAKFEDFTISRHRPQMALLHCGKPVVSENVAFLAPCATLIGSVRVQAGASIWYGAVLRADACLNANSFNKSDQEILEQGPSHLLQLASGETAEKGDQEEKEEEEEQEKPPVELYSYDTRFDTYDKGGEIHVGPDSNLQDGVLVTARKGNTIVGQGVTVGHLAQLHSCQVDDFALVGMGSLIGEGCHIETEALVAAGAVLPANTIVGAGELWVGQPARKIRDLSAEERQKLHYQSSEYVKVALSHQGVQELGGNLPEGITINDIVLNTLAQEESPHEFLDRRNKWNNTVYRQYVMSPERLAAIEAEDAEFKRLASGGRAYTREEQAQLLHGGEQASNHTQQEQDAATREPIVETASATAAELVHEQQTVKS